MHNIEKKKKKNQLKSTISHEWSQAMAKELKVMVSKAVSGKSCGFQSQLTAGRTVATLAIHPIMLSLSSMTKIKMLR